MTIRARFDGHVLIPLDPLDLPKDELLELEVVREEKEPARGSPAAILKAMREMEPISREDADALERAIAEGQTPARFEGIFDELAEEEEE